MVKRKITRADFAGLRILRPERRSASPVRRTIGDMTPEEYYYYMARVTTHMAIMRAGMTTLTTRIGGRKETLTGASMTNIMVWRI